ncbi:Transposase and inactivated derivatives [Lutispora thermophila DSM 19022]|uniref:Transposase and inactivated derivatives n=1 Tax=Lutispora thermophila DSM 19022 TaxID=1122184 RepID=A0A1M6J6K7_9FIRM|nr:Transposase and inactivated derivatives [Lutispora thermophila DSM 19022]
MKHYDDKFKEQVIKECQEVGNISLVARRHDISKTTIFGWIKTYKKRGSVAPLPKDKDNRVKELEHRLNVVSIENDRLKKLVAEKELELLILRELRDRVNPK